jgi:hypothetical protein
MANKKVPTVDQVATSPAGWRSPDPTTSKYKSHLARARPFNIKRDKRGGGFSLTMSKKIKGFEEELEMPKDQIDEISKYTAKRYIKGASRSISKIAKSQAGGTSDAEGSKAENKIKNREKGIDKAVHRIQGKYYPKHVRQRNPYGGGTRKYEGSAHGEKLYKPSVKGGSYPPSIKSGEERERFPRKMGRLGPYRANEENDMTKEQLDETSKEKAQAYLRQAPTDLATHEWETGYKYSKGNERDAMERHARKGINRITGIRRAVKKVSEEDEYEMDEDEINEISKAKAQRYVNTAQDTDAPEDDKLTRSQRNRARGMATAGLKVAGKGVRVPATEEYDMDEDEVPVTEVSDLVVHAIDQRPLEFQQSFSDLMQQRIEDAVHNAKLGIAAGFVANTEPIDVEFEDEDEETDDDEDWDGTEYEEEEDNVPGEPEEI